MKLVVLGGRGFDTDFREGWDRYRALYWEKEVKWKAEAAKIKSAAKAGDKRIKKTRRREVHTK
jgi:hypothetical protein